jgi:hypothetical protein
MSHRESLHSNMVPTAIGLSHSLGHKLGASYSISHGQCSVFTLSPSVLLLSRTLPLGSWGLTSLSAALSAIPSSFLPTDLDEGVPSEIGENEERRNAWKVGMAVEEAERLQGGRGQPDGDRWGCYEELEGLGGGSGGKGCGSRGAQEDLLILREKRAISCIVIECIFRSASRLEWGCEKLMKPSRREEEEIKKICAASSRHTSSAVIYAS